MSLKQFPFACISLILLLVACNPVERPITVPPEETPVEASDVHDYDTLRSYLEASGSVSEAGDITQPFFRAKGRVLVMNDAVLQVFDYESDGDAEADISTISPDGMSTGTMQMSWMEPPHFYHKGTLVVLYVGTDEDILSALREALGEQFAGQ